MRVSNAWAAVQLLERTGAGTGLIMVLESDQKAHDLALLLMEMRPDLPVFWFPAWDCLPYDRASASPDIMGHRMRVLHDLGAVNGSPVIVTTAEGVLQRVPPGDALPPLLKVKSGALLDAEAFAADCTRRGYRHADRVEDPGQIAVRGEVIDLYPPTPRPFRITVIEGRVQSIHRFDPATQRSLSDSAAIRVDAVTEVVPEAEWELEPFQGCEHWLPLFYPRLVTLFDIVPSARVLVEPGAEPRLAQHLAAVTQAHHDRTAADKGQPDARKCVEPARLFVTDAEWQKIRSERTDPYPPEEPSADVPLFHLDDKPGRALAAFAKKRRGQNHRLIFSAPRDRDLATLGKEAERLAGSSPVRLTDWREIATLKPGAVGLIKLSADHGFDDEGLGIKLITSTDLLGHHARRSSYHAVHMPWHAGDGEFALDDLVIHTEHGVGVLKGLETISDGAAAGREAVRIDYARHVDLLAPVDELDRIWRYGSEDAGLALDRLHTDGWASRWAKIMAEVSETARTLVRLAQERGATAAPKIVAPRRAFESFVAGFAYAPTPDQMHAVDACLADLASGRPMDRLVVGDVGFGKTEVALRTAAAAVLAGWQVALIAPTTVLVRQHVHTFERRFAALNIEVAQLSRAVGPADARRVKEGLADGTVRLVIGTHALLGDGIAFKKLGLLIVDEEQRFGAADKLGIRELGTGVHTLTLTATPIPRTLQSALVGLQDLSVIATPPARRRPIRTLLAPFDEATVRTALLSEKNRGGQGFVVTPRIEDLEPLARKLTALMPELKIVIAHGRLDAHAVEEVMLGFANGEGDVLLATSIIESGLDVPRANTMIVCHADRFGLAQLHQMRGRVGRGRTQGVCYLMTEAGQPLTAKTEKRLSTLVTLDRLGSGMAISVQDLDARGAGDLVGDDQAGHMRLIGLGLYQHLLQRAIREARGETVADWVPEIHGGDRPGRLPEAYIPEQEVRLNLYARMARVETVHDADALAEEIEDRFGPPPDDVEALLATTRLRCLCRTRWIERVDAGPKAIALTPRPGLSPEDLVAALSGRVKSGVAVKNGRLLVETTVSADARSALLERIVHALPVQDGAEPLAEAS